VRVATVRAIRIDFQEGAGAPQPSFVHPSEQRGVGFADALVGPAWTDVATNVSGSSFGRTSPNPSVGPSTLKTRLDVGGVVVTPTEDGKRRAQRALCLRIRPSASAV
jgi:hypothetical protein